MCERRDSSYTRSPDVKRIEQIVSSGPNVRDSIRETRLARIVYEIHTEGVGDRSQKNIEVGELFGPNYGKAPVDPKPVRTPAQNDWISNMGA